MLISILTSGVERIAGSSVINCMSSIAVVTSPAVGVPFVVMFDSAMTMLLLSYTKVKKTSLSM